MLVKTEKTIGFNGGELRISLKKRGIYESSENIFLCRYSENRDKLFRKLNGHDWVQLHEGGMVCNWGSGRGFRVGLICGCKTLSF